MIQSIFETYRCYVRPFTAGDFLLAKRLLQNEEVMLFSTHGPLEDDEVRLFLYKNINSQRDLGYSLWAAFTLEDQFLGFTGLLDQEVEGEKFIEIGYRLMPEYWRLGYASELVQGVLYWAFDALKDLTHLSSIIDPRNVGSLKVAEKNMLSRYREGAVFHGLPCDIYRISKKTYQEGCDER